MSRDTLWRVIVAKGYGQGVDYGKAGRGNHNRSAAIALARDPKSAFTGVEYSDDNGDTWLHYPLATAPGDT